MLIVRQNPLVAKVIIKGAGHEVKCHSMKSEKACVMLYGVGEVDGGLVKWAQDFSPRNLWPKFNVDFY